MKREEENEDHLFSSLRPESFTQQSVVASVVPFSHDPSISPVETVYFPKNHMFLQKLDNAL